MTFIALAQSHKHRALSALCRYTQQQRHLQLLQKSSSKKQSLLSFSHAMRQQVFRDADSSITVAQRKQKETYERKYQPEEMAEGTMVLLEYTAQKQRKGGKMESLWLGPYVHQHTGKGVYELSSYQEEG